ncbi:MAG: nucleoside-diphosphate sugar epimerase/dehydratase [Candidatus Latescibacterota bacterium]
MAKRLLIIGAGEAGRMVVREILSHPESDLEIVGFLDDELSLQGQNVEGYPVLGVLNTLADIAARSSLDEVLISVPSAQREFLRRVITLCRDVKLPFKIVPGLIEIIKGSVRLDQIREVHPEDLLGRETVEFDESLMKQAIAQRRVLVTGAGGSIGGEICRQVAHFDPVCLYLLGRGENQIYNIEHEMRTRFPMVKIEPIIADIREKQGLARIFARLRPHYVYHAAAHKHVHYMEAFPEEAVRNNVLGTANVIAACKESEVERLVMLSTDKAVEPIGVMGATKRLAEYMMVDESTRTDTPRFLTVRFGNVLGSRGSVIPLFIKQIQRGGPVTVSTAEASRFFMTLKEACMLVVQASIIGKGGEIFILRMGEPIKIIEIAKDLIALHGLRPDIDIKIDIVGLRPGEKTHEALIADGEVIDDSPHKNILSTRAHVPYNVNIKEVIANLRDATERGDRAKIIQLLNQAIPDARLTVQ